MHAFDKIPQKLNDWLPIGSKPVYIGFGSNGVSDKAKLIQILGEVLQHTNERILFCTGWSVFENLPKHENLFVAKYLNHEAILPQCKAGVFHGGAGTLAAMLRNNLPVIIVSFYTDQPAWGKIAERKKLGVHISAKKLTAQRLITAIDKAQSSEIRNNVFRIGEIIRNENGLDIAVSAIEVFFKKGN